MKSSIIPVFITFGVLAILFACSFSGVHSEGTDCGTVEDTITISLGEDVCKTVSIPVSYHSTLGASIIDVKTDCGLITELGQTIDTDAKGYGPYVNRFVNVTFIGTPETTGTFTTTATVEFSYQYRAILTYDIELTVIVTE